MTNDWHADIDHHKSKLSVKYTDRRSTPYHHLTVTVDKGAVTIKTEKGKHVHQQITLQDKTLERIDLALGLIDCPPKQAQLALSILATLGVRDK